MDAIVRARDSVRNKMVSPPLFLKKLRAAGGQRDKREKDRCGWVHRAKKMKAREGQRRTREEGI